MKPNRKHVFIFGVFTVCLVCFQQIAAQNKYAKLSEVKSIFVESSGDKKQLFGELLKVELKRAGFVIAEEKKTADAVFSLDKLKVEWEPHKDKTDLDKVFYESELGAPSGEVIWKKRITLLTAGYDEKIELKACQSIADALAADVLKAQKKKKPSKEK